MDRDLHYLPRRKIVSWSDLCYVQAMSKVTITSIPNGPYKVSGEVELTDAAGNKLAVKPGQDIFLCRCGASTTKPYCDGTHSKMGFKAAEAAVREEKPKKTSD